MDPALDRSDPPISIGTLASQGPEHSAPAESETARLARLWHELITGACRIEQSELGLGSCALVVSRQALSRRPICDRDRRALELTLLHGAQKSVAAELWMSSSSIAGNLRQSFAYMGLSCWPSRIPLAPVLAVHAFYAAPSAARSTPAGAPGVDRERITVSWPYEALAARLTPAQSAVALLVVAGKSYEEIAALRRTSTRTVANQLAAVFRALNISGRAELLCLLARLKFGLGFVLACRAELNYEAKQWAGS